ncbi:MAG: sulfotransferase domain-containing protein [Spiribacter salinus]|uniref:Sulfotransferase domain-containing protein n=1 Tax=Spiribacter salinus TaxID=1335746 RepID=A0A540VQI3_9GAMM|nr:MAG: sulfotransferase domain-containing protein [Spiribacter salinus]
MSFPPELFLIGAQKSGTTYLAGMLGRQRGITLAEPKEPHFFTREWRRGLNWYRACFPESANGILLDASPSYSAAPVHLGPTSASNPETSALAGVPQRIREVAPAARFLYLMRHPVDRMWSSYWHDVRYRGLRRPFEDAIEVDPRYRNASNYLAQIELYQRCFPEDRFLFLLFEDLASRPQSVLRECLDFLGMERNDASEGSASGRHGGYVPVGPARAAVHAVRRSPALNQLQTLLWGKLPRSTQRWIKRSMTRPVPEMPAATRRALEAEFSTMVSPLERLTGRNLECWDLRSDPSPVHPASGQ